jgi:hypothetical protein
MISTTDPARILNPRMVSTFSQDRKNKATCEYAILVKCDLVEE